MRNKFLSARLGILSAAAILGHNKPDDLAGAGDPAPAAAEKPKTLAAAQERLADLEGKVSAAEQRATAAEANLAAEKQRADTAEANLQAVNQQFEALTIEATAAKNDLAQAQTQITALTNDLDAVRKDHATAAGNVARLEKLCGLKGINPTAAAEDIGAMSDSDKVCTRADFDAMSQADRSAFFAAGGQIRG